MTIEEILKTEPSQRLKDAHDKIVNYNAKLNAAITIPEYELSTKEGKLFNIPVGVKDNISTKGIKTTAASNILDNYVPVFDATVIQKLKAAGGVIVAKTSMDELGMGGSNLTANIGPCHNPYDLSCISGGSSGGSAVLVASGAVPLALGTDTGDSIRKPASFNGVVGVKPTYGRISRYGVIPYASSLDHVGYFTANVHDAALALEVLAGRDDLDMTSSFKEVEEYTKLLNGDVKGKKILVFDNVIKAINDQTILEAFDKLLEGLKEKGAIIRHVYFDNDLMRCIFGTYFIIANAEATANHSNLDGIRFGHRVDGDSMEEVMINTRTRGFSSFIKKRFVVGSYSLFEENQDRLLKKAHKVRRLIVEAILKELKEADCLIAPASGMTAPKINSEEKIDELTDAYLIAENHMIIGNFGGLPSMTLPLGFKEGMPFGVNITANAFKESDMFNIGAAIEEVTGLKDLFKEDF